jgi:hypothetical protein
VRSGPFDSPRSQGDVLPSGCPLPAGSWLPLSVCCLPAAGGAHLPACASCLHFLIN